MKSLRSLSIHPERREISDLQDIASLINDPLGLQYSSFLALYSKLHSGPQNLTHSLDHQHHLYLLEGSITFSKPHQKQKTKILSPAKVVHKEGMKISIDDHSFALAVSKSQVETCLSLRYSSILEEIEFLKGIPYFSNLSKIVCQNLLCSAIVRIYSKGEEVPRMSQCLYLVRDGEFQSYEEHHELFGNKRIQYRSPLITFSKGLFVKISNKFRCKSAEGRIYCFRDQFVRNYIEVICGGRITDIADRRQRYLSQKSKSVDMTKKVCLNYLTQTKFQREIQAKSISVRKIAYSKSKVISSRNPQQGFNEFQELERLESKRNRCILYKELFPLNMNKKEDILSRMSKSIKDDLQSRDRERREAKKTLIF